MVRALPCHGRGQGFESPPLQYGWVPEWPKGADCKSVSIAFGGPNPPPSTARKCTTARAIALLIWGVSSAGRASALQAGGHRFEPYTPHFFRKTQ